jgi:hypothetical protein
MQDRHKFIIPLNVKKPICQINHSTHVKEIIVKHINAVTEATTQRTKGHLLGEN